MTVWRYLVMAVFVSGSSAAFGQASTPRDFKFSEVDEKLLVEVETVDQQMQKKGLVFNDPGLTAHLEELAKPILASVSPPERVQWKFRILRDPSVNAFAMPNGSIYVHTGLLALLENDAQLAGILAHEITHVTNRHTYLQYRSYRKKSVALHVLAAASSWAPVSTTWGAAINVVGAVSQGVLVATIFGYSRDLEREADRFAVERVAVAGYDPMQVPSTFKLLDEKLEVEPVETFYRDHPKLEERVAYTSPLAKSRTVAVFPSAPSEPYLAVVEKAIRYNVLADIDSRRFRTAVARAQRLVNFRPNDSENTFLLAEAYRGLGARTPEPTEKDLTSRGKGNARTMLLKRTVQEEEAALISRPDGPATRQANWTRSEELYQKALSLDPANAKAHRGLASLYEEQDKSPEALVEYRKYLELAPEGSDTLRIQRRIDALHKTLKLPNR